MSDKAEQSEPLMSGNEDNDQNDQYMETQPPAGEIPLQYYPVPAYTPQQPLAAPAYSQQSTSNTVVVQQPGASYISAPQRPESFLFLSIFTCLCCFWPTAIVAIVHSCQVGDRYNSGDFAGAEYASKRAYYWSKVSIIVGLVSVFVLIGFYILFGFIVPVAAVSG